MKADYEVMSDAIDILTPDKAWNKGSWCIIDRDNNISYCAEGAIVEAVTQVYTKRRWTNHLKKWTLHVFTNSFGEGLRALTQAAPGELLELELIDIDEYSQIIRLSQRLGCLYTGESYEELYSYGDDDRPTPMFNDDKTTTREDIMLGMKKLREDLLQEHLKK